MTVHSLFQPTILLAVALFALVIALFALVIVVALFALVIANDGG
jgi:hypothetical protein